MFDASACMHKSKGESDSMKRIMGAGFVLCLTSLAVLSAAAPQQQAQSDSMKHDSLSQDSMSKDKMSHDTNL